MSKVIYTGASDAQVRWGSNDDPRGFCNGTASITINKITRQCPECYGQRGCTTYETKAWNVVIDKFKQPQKLTIGQIRLEHTERTKELKWTAMCNETGVGSGTIHDVSLFFTTLKAAQKECDLRNNKLNP